MGHILNRARPHIYRVYGHKITRISRNPGYRHMRQQGSGDQIPGGQDNRQSMERHTQSLSTWFICPHGSQDKRTFGGTPCNCSRSCKPSGTSKAKAHTIWNITATCWSQGISTLSKHCRAALRKRPRHNVVDVDRLSQKNSHFPALGRGRRSLHQKLRTVRKQRRCLQLRCRSPRERLLRPDTRHHEGADPGVVRHTVLVAEKRMCR